MPNQYSITVSDETDTLLKELKKSGYKVSQVIDAGIKTLGHNALVRLVANERFRKAMKEDSE